jgi:hypothetical protein
MIPFSCKLSKFFRITIQNITLRWYILEYLWIEGCVRSKKGEVTSNYEKVYGNPLILKKWCHNSLYNYSF